MPAYVPADWKDFFIATSGASAALAGLLFVGLSLNLTRIMEIPGLPDRAGETVMALVSVLVASLLGLVPQPPEAVAVEWLLTGTLVWGVTTWLHGRAIRHRLYDTPWHGYQRVVLAQAATLPLVIAAAAMLGGTAGAAYWLVPALILPLAVSVLNAWVLLVEIMR